MNPATVERLLALIAEASALVMRGYGAGLDVRTKADKSPVTEADEAAEHLIAKVLHDLDPAIPMVGEEAVSAGRVPDVAGKRFWLVDPIDGTKSYIKGEPEFTVNIGLAGPEGLIMGLITAPAREETFLGIVGKGAWQIAPDGTRTPIKTRPFPAEGVTALVSRHHGPSGGLGDTMDGHPVAGRVPMSSSLKFCILARGEADFAINDGRTSEWDTAAGHAILAAAGGWVGTPDGAPLHYGKKGFVNGPYRAWGRDPRTA